MPKYVSKNGVWTPVNNVKKEEVVELSIEIKDTKPTYDELDINHDGNVDAKDATLASKVLSNAKEVKAKRGRKKKSS